MSPFGLTPIDRGELPEHQTHHPATRRALFHHFRQVNSGGDSVALKLHYRTTCCAGYKSRFSVEEHDGKTANEKPVISRVATT